MGRPLKHVAGTMCRPCRVAEHHGRVEDRDDGPLGREELAVDPDAVLVLHRPSVAQEAAVDQPGCACDERSLIAGKKRHDGTNLLRRAAAAEGCDAEEAA